MKELSQCRFSWDEPPDCSSPRGWLHLDNHPDKPRADQSTCSGFYLDYEPGHSRGPNGETILASAYVFRYQPLRSQERIGLGYQWFNSIEEAKAFIEGNVRAYFGLPREGK